MKKETREMIESSLDKLKISKNIVFVSYPFYTALVKILGSKCEFVDVQADDEPNLSHSGLAIGEFAVLPDHRIDP